MFTGLIEEIGTVLSVCAAEKGPRLQITAPKIASQVRTGDSVAVNGCCLTVALAREDELTFDLLQETLDRTNLGALRRDKQVNLERALAADGRLGGHFVQGHVDCTARTISFERRGADHRLEIELPTRFAHYVASKGSIAVNGVSLTVAEVHEVSFTVWIIPHTKDHTDLESTHAGDLVNLEFDVIAKYVERMLHRYGTRD
jgi:riboflavin synthase